MKLIFYEFHLTVAWNRCCHIVSSKKKICLLFIVRSMYAERGMESISGNKIWMEFMLSLCVPKDLRIKKNLYIFVKKRIFLRIYWISRRLKASIGTTTIKKITYNETSLLFFEDISHSILYSVVPFERNMRKKNSLNSTTKSESIAIEIKNKELMLTWSCCKQ